MPRIPYVDEDELPPDYREYIVSSLQPGKRVNAYAAVANNPDVIKGFRQFLGSLWSDSGLSDREREIVIMTVATELDSEYEWHQHCNIAPDAGLSPEEVVALARDDHTHFTRAEQALISYSRAVTRMRVTDVLHEAVAEHYDERTLAGVAATAAGYAALAMLIDAFDAEIEGDETFVGWDLAG